MAFKRAYDLIYHITEEYKVDTNKESILKEPVTQFCLDGMADNVRAYGAKNWVCKV